MRLRFLVKPSYLVGVSLWFSICLQSATGLFYSEKAYAEDKHCFCEVSFVIFTQKSIKKKKENRNEGRRARTHINNAHFLFPHAGTRSYKAR